MEQTGIFPERIRRLAIATGVASALTLFPVFSFLYPVLLIVGGKIQPRYTSAGKWLVWAGAANLCVVVVQLDTMMLQDLSHQTKSSLNISSVYIVLTFSVSTVLLMWCSVELIVNGLKRMFSRRSIPPAEPQPVSLGIWILVVVLNLLVVWEIRGWALAPSWFRHSDIFYNLGMAIVQAVLVVAFDISLLRRVVKLRRALRAGKTNIDPSSA